MPEDLSNTGRKYAGIDRAGTKAIIEGTVQEFGGFPESLNNRFNVSFLLTPESESLFRKRVTDPLAVIGAELGIKFYLAGKDFRTHSTLLEGLYEGADLEERAKKFEKIQTSPAVKTARELVGRKLEYKYLLTDKGNVLLTAIDIPDWLVAARQELAKTYALEDLKPLILEDILHISVARMTSLPTEERGSKFREYRQKMAKLRHQISADPLTLEVGAISTVPPLELLRI